jgi:hypothetical protein
MKKLSLYLRQRKFGKLFLCASLPFLGASCASQKPVLLAAPATAATIFSSLQSGPERRIAYDFYKLGAADSEKERHPGEAQDWRMTRCPGLPRYGTRDAQNAAEPKLENNHEKVFIPAQPGKAAHYSFINTVE